MGGARGYSGQFNKGGACFGTVGCRRAKDAGYFRFKCATVAPYRFLGGGAIRSSLLILPEIFQLPLDRKTWN
jgi:hypothetical protein